jgi:hypothetical protein
MNVTTGARASTRITADYIPCGDVSIDSYITGSIENYYSETANGQRTAFREAGIKDKIAITCWKWGESSDPEVQTHSKELKAKLLMRSMARVILAGDPDQTETKHNPILDDYWREVDEKFRNEIDEFARRHDGRIIPYHLEFIGDSDNKFEPMIEVNDFRILGRFLIRSGILMHAEYLAQHNSKTMPELVLND